MRTFALLVSIVVLACACNKNEEKNPPTPVAPAPFQFTNLPDQEEWTVPLDTPLKVVRQEIQSTELPRPVWDTFPLPEFAKSKQAMTRPGTSRSYGYGMDSGGCVPEALLKSNGIDHEHGWGIAAGQYSYFSIVDVEDPLLYNPTEHGFLIAYPEGNYRTAYLEITFPDLSTMKVRRLKRPDTSKVKHCGPGDDWRQRFEG